MRFSKPHEAYPHLKSQDPILFGQTALTIFRHYGFDHLEPFCCIGLCHFVDTMLNSCGCGFTIGRPAMLIWSHLAGHFVWSLRVKMGKVDIWSPQMHVPIPYFWSDKFGITVLHHKCVDLDRWGYTPGLTFVDWRTIEYVEPIGKTEFVNDQIHKC